MCTSCPTDRLASVQQNERCWGGGLSPDYQSELKHCDVNAGPPGEQHKSLACEMLAQEIMDSVCVHWVPKTEYHQGEKQVGKRFQGKIAWFQTGMPALKSGLGSLPGFPSHHRPCSPVGLGQQACSYPPYRWENLRFTWAQQPAQGHTAGQAENLLAGMPGSQLEPRWPPVSGVFLLSPLSSSPSGILGPAALIP